MAGLPAGHPGAVTQAPPAAAVVHFARNAHLALGPLSRCQSSRQKRGHRQGNKDSVTLNASYPHRIRLRGPWECERIGISPSSPALLPEGEGSDSPWRVLMPCGWIDAGLDGYRGTAQFTRKFGYPGR